MVGSGEGAAGSGARQKWRRRSGGAHWGVSGRVQCCYAVSMRCLRLGCSVPRWAVLLLGISGCAVAKRSAPPDAPVSVRAQASKPALAQPAPEPRWTPRQSREPQPSAVPQAGSAARCRADVECPGDEVCTPRGCALEGGPATKTAPSAPAPRAPPAPSAPPATPCRGDLDCRSDQVCTPQGCEVPSRSPPAGAR